MKKITRKEFLSYGGFTILGTLLLTMIGLNVEELLSNDPTPEPHRRKWTAFGADIKPADAYKAIAKEWDLDYGSSIGDILGDKFHYLSPRNGSGKEFCFPDTTPLEESLKSLTDHYNLELLLNQTTIKVGNEFKTVPAYHYLGEKV